MSYCFFFFQAEDGIRDIGVTGVQTCALPISAERRRVHLDLVTGATVLRILVTLAAVGGVEERAQAGLGSEDAVEHRASPLEAVALVARQPQHGISRLDHPAAGEGEGGEAEGRRSPGAAHGVGFSFSTLSATRLPPARWHRTRT